MTSTTGSSCIKYSNQHFDFISTHTKPNCSILQTGKMDSQQLVTHESKQECITLYSSNYLHDPGIRKATRIKCAYTIQPYEHSKICYSKYALHRQKQNLFNTVISLSTKRECTGRQRSIGNKRTFHVLFLIPLNMSSYEMIDEHLLETKYKRVISTLGSVSFDYYIATVSIRSNKDQTLSYELLCDDISHDYPITLNYFY